MSCRELESLLNETCNQASETSRDYDFCTTAGQRKFWKIRDGFGFWKGYCDLANPHKLQGEQQKKLNLGEIPGNLIPLIFDINLEFNLPDEILALNRNRNGISDEQINEKIENAVPQTDLFIIQMISCIQEVLRNNFHVENQLELACSIFQCQIRECTTTKIITKIKLQFPYFKTHSKVQTQIIFPKCINLFRERNIMGSLKMQPINDWFGIIDTKYAEKAIPLYGSTNKNVNDRFIYEMTLKYIDWTSVLGISQKADNELEEDDIEHLIVPLEGLFFPSYHNHCQKYGISSTLFETGYPIEYWIPFFHSIHYHSKEMQLLSKQLEEIFKQQENVDNNSIYISQSANSLIKEFRNKSRINRIPDIELAQTFLNMINPLKATQECYWLDIGRALFSCSPNDINRGLAMWKDFTAKNNGKNPRITLAKCDDLYMSFLNDNPVTIKSLAFYAREDSPDQYSEWHRHWKQDSMMAAIRAKKTEHSIVAEAFYKTYWLEFLCYQTSPQTFSWVRYQPGTHSWKEVARTVDLLSILSNEFRNEFLDLKIVLDKEANTSQDEDVRSRCSEMKNYLENLTSNLCNKTYKNNIASTLEEYFFSYSFREFRDKNPDLMSVRNAVIQCMDTEAVVRPGKPEDYITKFSNVYWDSSINEKMYDHKNVQKVIKWFRQTYPDDKLCEYVVKLFASCLRAGNLNKIIAVMTGGGNNSKSAIKKLIEYIFNTYSYTFPTSILTVKPGNSSNASPELALADGCKIAWVQEPGKEQEFMGGMLKILSGQDKVFARKLHDNGGNMNLSFTLFIVCNDVPKVGVEKALENRIRIIPHLATWVPPHLAPKSEFAQFEQHIFPIDKNFEEKIPEMASAGLWLFVQFYAMYRTKGLEEPEIVTKHTEAYWNETDPFRIFCRNKIREVFVEGTASDDNPRGDRDKNSRLSTNEVYQTYKFWFRNAYPSKIPMEEQMVIKELSRKWRTAPEDGYWYGLAINDMEGGNNFSNGQNLVFNVTK